MELEKLLSDYAASIIIADEAMPSAVKKYMDENSEMSAGLFLKRLKELRITGSEFLELLGNSKIGNTEFRRIQNNPHMRFEELLDTLDNSNLENNDYQMMLAVAAQHYKIKEEQRKAKELKAKAERDRAKQLLERAMQDADKKLSEELPTAAAPEPPEAPAIPAKPEVPAAPAEVTTPVEVEKPAKAEMPAQLELSADIEKPAETVTPPAKIETPAASADDTAAKDEESRKRAELYLEKALREVEKELGTQQEKQPASDTAKAEEKSVGEKFADLPKSEEKSANVQIKTPVEYEDEDDDVEPDAKSIGSFLEEICEPGAKADDKTHGAKRPFLRVTLALAAVLLCVGVSYKLLRNYGIIPTYTYQVTDRETQNITDYASLLSESARLAQTVSDKLPDGMTAERTAMPKPIRLVADGFVLTVDSMDDKSVVKGAKLENGYLSDAFSFESELTDAFLLSIKDKFALVGKADGFTVIRYYSAESMSKGEKVCEIKQTGEYIAHYTDSKYIYMVSKTSNDLSKADANRPNTFLPYYEQNGKTLKVQFENVAPSACIFTGDYYLLTRSDGTISVPEVKAVNACANSNAEISDKGLCVSKTYNINGGYRTELTSVLFGGSLEVKSTVFDGYAYPSTLKLCGGNVCCIASVPDGAAYENALLISEISFENRGSSTPLDKGIYTGSSVCGNVYSFMKGTDHIFAMDIDSGTETPPIGMTTVKADENVYVRAYVEADSSGKRSGIRLMITDKNGTELASELIAASGTAQEGWNDYISTPAQENVLSLAVYREEKTVYIGVPVTYFDGISTVSEYAFFTYEDKELIALRKLSVYSVRDGYMHCRINEDGIVTFWSDRVITADKKNIKVISDIAL